MDIQMKDLGKEYTVELAYEKLSSFFSNSVHSLSRNTRHVQQLSFSEVDTESVKKEMPLLMLKLSSEKEYTLPLHRYVEEVLIGSLIGANFIHGKSYDYIFGGFNRIYDKDNNEYREISLHIKNDPPSLSAVEIEPFKIEELKDDSELRFRPMIFSDDYKIYSLFDALSDKQREILGIQKTVTYSKQGKEIEVSSDA